LATPPRPTREGRSPDFQFTLNKLERFRQAFLMPLNTISMGQTTNKNKPGLVKTGHAVPGGGRSPACGYRRLCSQGPRQPNLVPFGSARGGSGPAGLQSRSGVVGYLHGYPARLAWPPAGEPTALKKRYAGVMCRRGWLLWWSPKTPHWALRAKAGRQRLGRPRAHGGAGGPLNKGLSPSLGAGAFKNHANRDSRGGSYFLARGEIL